MDSRRTDLALTAQAMLIGTLVVLVPAACTREHPLDLELDTGDGGLDAQAVAIEVRLHRLEPGQPCPPLEALASASASAPLASVQSFRVAAAMGSAFGELPPGRWAVAAIARDASCTVVAIGCTALDVGPTATSPVVVSLAPQATAATCGACRACTDGQCDPLGAACR
ncbi:MAG: hypothetical protein IT378_00140 [Sandaracinaceae bacterium]|nr:hypothetical protein [Sandaracinaceae bacterium]